MLSGIRFQSSGFIYALWLKASLLLLYDTTVNCELLNCDRELVRCKNWPSGNSSLKWPECFLHSLATIVWLDLSSVWYNI